MYEALGYTGGKARLIAGIYNFVGPIANLIFITTLLDRVGRRKPLLWGTIGITVALLLEAIVNSQNTSPDTSARSEALSKAGVAFIFIVSIIFSFSFGPISWVYMSEIMPMQIRARGNAFATGIGNWLIATFWAQISPYGLSAAGWKFYFVFVAWNLCVTFPVIFFFFKETKKVTLEDIDLLFGERALGTLPDDLHKEGMIGTTEHSEATREAVVPEKSAV